MLKHFLLTSKKSAVAFSTVYLITRVLYLITPLTVAYLIQCVENKDSNCFVYTAVFYFVLFFVTQIMDYYTDITEEKCYADSYVLGISFSFSTSISSTSVSLKYGSSFIAL